VNVKIWRRLAATVAIVIAVYLTGSWIVVPGIIVGDVVAACNQAYSPWRITWWACPDRTPRTVELAGAGLGIVAVAWVAWIMVRRIIAALGFGAAKTEASE